MLALDLAQGGEPVEPLGPYRGFSDNMLSENEGIVLERHRTLVCRPRPRARPRFVRQRASQTFDYENEDDDEDENE